MPLRISASANFLRQRRQAEIGNPHLPAAVDHDVRWLQVAMQHAALVRGRQTGADLARKLDGFILGQPADAADQRGEVLAIEVFHRKEVRSFDEADIVDAADVGVRNLAGDAHFVAESRQRRFAHVGTAQKLQRHGLIEDQILSPIHLAHAAPSEHAEDPVSARQHRTGGKPAFVRAGGGRTAEDGLGLARDATRVQIGAATRAQPPAFFDLTGTPRANRSAGCLHDQSIVSAVSSSSNRAARVSKAPRGADDRFMSSADCPGTRKGRRHKPIVCPTEPRLRGLP